MGVARLDACCASGLCGAAAVKAAQKDADPDADSAVGEQVQVMATCGPSLASSGVRLLWRPPAEGGGVAVHAEAPGERPRAFMAQAFFGPESIQEELAGRAARAAERAVVEGRSSAVLCCGAGGLGKRRGLLGSRAAAGAERPGSVAGFLERALFDLMDAKCMLGDVFIVDVSCLQIGSHQEDRREQLRDLQPGPGLQRAGLRLLPDPLRPGLFVVDGLRRVPVLTRGDLVTALDGALGHCSEEDCHVVVTINIDRFGMDSSSGILTQMRSRLMLVDVAACDDLGRVSAAGVRGLAALRAALRPCRPLKAVRSLSARRQDSTINLLLDGCVGPTAEPALLLVHADPGAQGGLATVVGALAFAERVGFPSGPPRAMAPPRPAPEVRFRSRRYVAAAAASGPQETEASGLVQAVPLALAEAAAQPRQAAETVPAALDQPCCWSSVSALRGVLLRRRT